MPGAVAYGWVVIFGLCLIAFAVSCFVLAVALPRGAARRGKPLPRAFARNYTIAGVLFLTLGIVKVLGH